MIRKLVIVAGAAATLAAASLAPTAASAAHGWHGHHGHHGHARHWRGWHGPRLGFYAPVHYGASCYVVRQRVFTPYGPRIRRVTVCD